MGLKEIKEKRSNENVASAKPIIKTEETQIQSDGPYVPPNGSIRGNGFIMWYTGSERRRKSRRNVDDFPDRLPLEPLFEEDKQSTTFRVKPKKKAKPEPLLLEYKKEYTEKQKKWRENVITSEDLRQEVGPYKKSHNRLRLLRYVFINDVVYSINGLLYYLIPLIANIIFMILNLAVFSFVENVIVATACLLPLAILIATAKSKTNALFKFLIFLLTISLCVYAVINVKYYFPEFWANVYPPYVIKIFLIYFGFYYFGKYYVIWHIMYVQDLISDFGNVFKVKCGKPRVGKTSQAVQEAKSLALTKWRQLQYDYWMHHSREKQILENGDINELLEWYAIKESYEFYTRKPGPDENPGIPCLWSNIGIKDAGGRTSYQVTLDHIKGISRLPLYSVVFFDEIGAVLKSELSLKKGEFYDVSDMFRLGGHFLKWAVIGCEQDPKNIFIDCRRVAGANELVKSQQWVCKPVLALGIYNFLKTWKIDNLDKGSKRQPKWAKFMKGFESFVKSIGFRQQIVSGMGNLETGSETYVVNDSGERIPLGKNHIRYVASGINQYYDDRAYKQLYPSFFFKKIEGKTFKKLTINGFDLDNGTQFVSTTEQLKALRDALSEKIKEIA